MEFWDLKSLLANPIIRKVSPFIGSNEFPVDELLRNLGFGIALFPPSPSSVTGCPVQVLSVLRLDGPVVWVSFHGMTKDMQVDLRKRFPMQTAYSIY